MTHVNKTVMLNWQIQTAEAVKYKLQSLHKDLDRAKKAPGESLQVIIDYLLTKIAHCEGKLELLEEFAEHVLSFETRKYTKKGDGHDRKRRHTSGMDRPARRGIRSVPR